METKEVADRLGQMTVFELIALTKELEDKWGVKATPPAPVQEQGITTRGNAPWGTYPGEEVDLTVVLSEAGPNKINVIKAVRELFGLGLKEAKDLVDNAPRHLKEGLAKAEAEEMKSKLEAAGAKVELVPS